MNTELTPQQSFEQKLIDRIRTDIGELMPAEVLREVVKRAMEEAFFKPTPPVKSSWGRIEESGKPAWVVSAVKELLEKQMQAEIRDWLGRNHDSVKKVISEEIGKGAGESMVKAFNHLFSDALFKFQSDLNEKLSSIINS